MQPEQQIADRMMNGGESGRSLYAKSRAMVVAAAASALLQTLWALLPPPLLLVVLVVGVVEVGSVVVGLLWGRGTSMPSGGVEGPHASPLMVAEGALTPLCRGHPVRKKGLKIRIEMGVEVEGRGEEGGGKYTH